MPHPTSSSSAATQAIDHSFVPRAYMQAAAKEGVPSRLLYAIALHESAPGLRPQHGRPLALGTPAQAINASHNLAVGASILRANYERAKSD